MVHFLRVSNRLIRVNPRRSSMRTRTAIAFALAGVTFALVTAALAVGPTSVTQTGGLHFVGTPDVTATKDVSGVFLTATGEVAGAGTSATATLSADVTIVTGCINRGSKDQQPSGLQRSTSPTVGTQTFRTRSGRGTFDVDTTPVDASSRTCPDQMTPVLVSATFANVVLTITSGPNKTLTATFPDIDP
jgi:hypothetical protein